MKKTKLWLYGALLLFTGSLLTVVTYGEDATEKGKSLANRTQAAQSDSIDTVSDSNFLSHKSQDVSDLKEKQSGGNMQDEAATRAANDDSAALVIENYSNRDAYKIDPDTDPIFERKAEAGRDAMLVADGYEDCTELKRDGADYGEEKTCESTGSVYSEDYTCRETTTGSCGEDQITRYFAVYDTDPHCPYDANNPWKLEGGECVRGGVETLPAMQEKVYRCPIDEENPWSLVGTQCTRTVKDEKEAYGDPIFSCPDDGKEWEFNANDNKCRHYWTEIIPANGTPVFGCLDDSYTFDPVRKVCWKDTTETRPYESRTVYSCDNDSWMLEGRICKKTAVEKTPISEIGIGERYACSYDSKYVLGGITTYTKKTGNWHGDELSAILSIDKENKKCVYTPTIEYLPNINLPGRPSSWISSVARWRGAHPSRPWHYGSSTYLAPHEPNIYMWKNACGKKGSKYVAQIALFTGYSGNSYRNWGGANGSPVSCSRQPTTKQNAQVLSTEQTCPSGKYCVDNTDSAVLSCPSGYTKNGNYCEKTITQSKPANQDIEYYCPLGWTDNGVACERGGRDEHPADQVDTTYACPVGYSLQNEDECHRPRVDIVDAIQTGTNYYCDAGWLLQHPDMCYRFRNESRQAELDYIIYSCGAGWTLEEPDCVRGYEDRIAALGFEGETYPIEILSSFPPGPGATGEIIESYYDAATVPVDIRNLGGGQLQQPPQFTIDDGMDLGFIYAHVSLIQPSSMPVWGIQGHLYLTVDLRQGRVINYTFEQPVAGDTPVLAVDFGVSSRVGALKAGESVPWETGSVPAQVCDTLPLDGDLLGIDVQEDADIFKISAGVAGSSIVSAPACGNGLKATIRIPYTFTGLNAQPIHTGFGFWAGRVLVCDYSEETAEVCPSNKRWNAQHIDSSCTQGGWALINGFPVYRGCWSWDHEWLYEEIVMQESHACADLRAQGCGVLSSACIQEDTQGRCIRTQQTYSCGSGGDMQVAEICKSLFPCIDGECNAEYDTAKDATEDLAKVATSMELMSEMIEGMVDPDNIEFFSGEDAKCQKSSLGIKNCCSDSGWGVDIGITDCDAEEVALGYAKEEGRVVYVGKYESGTWPDKRKYHVHCTYSSKLAKLLVEQGNAQLRKGYGKPKKPRCDGFTQDEFNQLDLNAMDFSEYFQDALDKLENESPTLNQAAQDLGESIQARTGD
ncbi:conjugal transfer protein TraN [uncultured Microbulbifer sp.]|uniref:conjugal transfer protein TraN n=1 Tax=uncultured Microbulbifer sp. TaxID=348147 RepID=UPI00262FC8FB|nr:conjugal transfer protein TraN [uncultured Microbulbifer sp.]